MDGSLQVSDELIASETAALRRLARALLRDAAAADDLVQDTWLAAIRRPPATDRPIRPWLARVLRNTAASTLRSADRAKRREAAAAGPATTEPFTALDTARQLLEEIAELPDDDRQLLALIYWEGLSSAECAARLDRPASTVRTQLQRALTRLRRRLDENRGGRAAWMAAVMPLVGFKKKAGATMALTGVGLSLVGLASLGLVALGPNGCSADLAETPSANAGSASKMRESNRASTKPPAHRGTGSNSPSDAPADSTPANVGQGRAAPHPKVAYALAMRDTFAALQECRESVGPGSLRMQVEAVYADDVEPFIEAVYFDDPKNVTKDEAECMRQTMLAMAIPKPQGRFGSFRYTPTSDLVFDEYGNMTHRGINRGPTTHLFTATKWGDDLKEAAAKCDPKAAPGATAELELTFDPDSGVLVEVVGERGSRVSACVAKAVRDLVKPTRTFEPVHPEDATMRCSFALGEPDDYECRRMGPGGRYVDKAP